MCGDVWTMAAKKGLKEGRGGRTVKGAVRRADVKDCMGWAGRGGWDESSKWPGNTGGQEPGGLAGMPQERRGGVRRGMEKIREARKANTQPEDCT